jgi:Integrase core domain
MKEVTVHRVADSRGIEGRRSGSVGGAVDAEARHQRGEGCKEQDIKLRFIQPGKPDQNAYIECFNRTYREEVPSAYLFDSLEEVRETTAEWLERYNEITPHDALGSLPPARYRERLLAAETPAWNCLLEGGAYGQFAKTKRNNGAETPDSAVTKEFLSCESGWSKTIRRPL